MTWRASTQSAAASRRRLTRASGITSSAPSRLFRKAGELVRDGKPRIGHGLTDVRFTIAPPGAAAARRFSLVDVPDLQVLPACGPAARHLDGRRPVPESCTGPERVARGWCGGQFPSLRRSPADAPRDQIVRWGEHRGGMFVSVAGADTDGARSNAHGTCSRKATTGRSSRRWRSRRSSANASPATRPSRARGPQPPRSNSTTTRRCSPAGRSTQASREAVPRTDALPLYRRLLGEAYELLPAPIRMPCTILKGAMAAEGIATVTRGNRIARAADGCGDWFPACGPQRAGARRFQGR